MKYPVPAGYLNKLGASKVLGCGPRTIDNYMKRKLIPFYKFSNRVLFKEDELRAALERSRIGVL